MYRFIANSRATISSTAIFLSQQSRQYFSSPRGSDTSLAPHSAHRDFATDFRGMRSIYHLQSGNFQLLTFNFLTFNYGSSNPRGAPSSGAERPRARGDEAVLRR